VHPKAGCAGLICHTQPILPLPVTATQWMVKFLVISMRKGWVAMEGKTLTLWEKKSF